MGFFFSLFSCFVLFIVLCIVLLSFLMDSVWHCDHLVGEEGAGSFDLLWFIVNVLSVNVCLLILLLSLVGYPVSILYKSIAGLIY